MLVYLKSLAGTGSCGDFLRLNREKISMGDVLGST